ncbi:hypothetical protein POM88_022946 [Heracleum sosnowskyi]|uniref:Apple domain-containing protein n=1 Tax=Heracleum sosnowskyi TaxID=360622 RepID=A0AAD8IHT7_9APIA|nr:hypothetical protein POM88_022946 [Heracleum sosnowskyi]
MGGREVRGLKWPDFADTAATNDIIKCKDLCVKNCTCNAYTFASGIRCMIWSGNFVDVEHFDEGGNSLYVRLTKSELDYLLENIQGFYKYIFEKIMFILSCLELERSQELVDEGRVLECLFSMKIKMDVRRFGDGGIFIGNLRKPVEEAIPVLEQKLSEAADREVVLWLMEEKTDDITKQVCMVQPKAEIDLQLELTRLSTPWGYLSSLALCVTTFGTIALMRSFFLKPDATFNDYLANVVPLFSGFNTILGVSEMATRITAARYGVKLSPSLKYFSALCSIGISPFIFMYISVCLKYIGHVQNTPRNVTPCPTLFVASLGPTASEQELVQVFSRCPGYLKLKMQKFRYAKSRMGMRSKHSR